MFSRRRLLRLLKMSCALERRGGRGLPRSFTLPFLLPLTWTVSHSECQARHHGNPLPSPLPESPGDGVSVLCKITGKISRLAMNGEYFFSLSYFDLIIYFCVVEKLWSLYRFFVVKGRGWTFISLPSYLFFWPRAPLSHTHTHRVYIRFSPRP